MQKSRFNHFIRRPPQTWFCHLIQLLLRFVLHASYVIHGQIDPFVDPAEELSVELVKQTLLDLDTKSRSVWKWNRGKAQIRQQSQEGEKSLLNYVYYFVVFQIQCITS